MCAKLEQAKLQPSNARKRFSHCRLNKGSGVKHVHFQQKTGHISETVRYTAKVTINH